MVIATCLWALGSLVHDWWFNRRWALPDGPPTFEFIEPVDPKVQVDTNWAVIKSQIWSQYGTNVVIRIGTNAYNYETNAYHYETNWPPNWGAIYGTNITVTHTNIPYQHTNVFINNTYITPMMYRVPQYN